MNFPNSVSSFQTSRCRLGTHTAKHQGINIHLLFSPGDPEHENTIERILSHLEFETLGPAGRVYRCDAAGLVELGRHFDPTISDPALLKAAGANQFKVSFEQIKELFNKEAWLRSNCLVAVSGGKNDGTSGLQHDDAYVTLRRRLNDSRISYFPPRRANESSGLESGLIRQRPRSRGCTEPGSPASTGLTVMRLMRSGFRTSIDSVAEGRNVFRHSSAGWWSLNAEVWIGDKPPADGGGLAAVVGMRVKSSPWLNWPDIPINPGLVAVIGPRGSGKSALVEVIARGARVATESDNNSSFLQRAGELLGDSQVELTWGDDSRWSFTRLNEPNASEDSWLYDEGVRYLSQHFVERMCSGLGLAKDLRREIERVVFSATDPSRRMNCSSLKSW